MKAEIGGEACYEKQAFFLRHLMSSVAKNTIFLLKGIAYFGGGGYNGDVVCNATRMWANGPKVKRSKFHYHKRRDVLW